MPVVPIDTINYGLPMPANLLPGGILSQSGSSTNSPHHPHHHHTHHTHHNFAHGQSSHHHHPGPLLTSSQLRKRNMEALERRLANAESLLRETQKEVEKMKKCTLDIGEKLPELEKACDKNYAKA